MQSVLKLFAAVSLGLALMSCATSSKGTTTKPKALLPFIEDYNNMIRWKQPEKAAPHVHPDASIDYKIWSKKNIEKFDYQDWSLEAVTYETDATATVVIERVGYEIPKYIEKKMPTVQVWEYDDNLGWRIREGF